MDFTSQPAGNNEPTLAVRDTARYRALLLAKREELAAAAEGAESLVPPANDKSGDLIDWARADTEAELQVQRRESDAHLMRAIEDALARINRGSFGVCEVCKQPISRPRLEAVPWTRTCRDCKEEQSRTAGKSGQRGISGPWEEEEEKLMGTTSPATFVRKSIGWSIGLSVLMIVAGIIAIASPMAAGIAVNLLVAWLLVFSGCVHLVFAWHTRSAGGFLWELLVGILYVLIGIYLLMHPLAGLASLTIALAIYLFLEAILEFVLGFILRPHRGSGWLLFDGIVTLLLAVMIWRAWPSSSAWVIGTLVGISMLFSGICRLVFSLAARSIATKVGLA